jgi:ketosteroid isomerase-like protein
VSEAAGLSEEAMSQENVEKLRAFCESWGKRDEVDLSLLDPDVIFEDNVLPDHARETYHGHEGVIRATRAWLEPYGEFALELEQIVGTGDRLVSIHRFRAKGRHSGIEEGGRYAYLSSFRNARVIRFVAFRDPAEALEAAGLPE